MCFNDPTTRAFVVFDHRVYDLGQLTMPKYRSGRGFIVYEDLGGNL